MSGESLTNEQKDFIREFVAEGQTDEDKTNRRSEMAAEFGVTLPTIRAITAWTKIRQKQLLGTASPAERHETEPVRDTSTAAPADVPAAVIPPEHHANEVIGLQYKNETKEKWFHDWLSFITSKTTPEWRGQAKLITLAGPLCLRLPEYLQAGFQPENIVAVEGGSNEEKRLFQQNVPAGVQQRLNRLENFIGTEQTKFDVVDYDFLGPVNDTYLHIIEQTPLSKRAFVLVNVMGRRESNRSKEILQLAHDDFSNERTLKTAIAAQKTVFKAGKLETAEDTAKAIGKSVDVVSNILEDLEDTELSQARADALVGIFVNGFGRLRATEGTMAETIRMLKENLEKRWRTSDVDLCDVDKDTHSICTGLSVLIHNHISQHGLQFPWPKQLGAVINIPRRSIWRLPLLKSLVKKRYLSEKHSTPYYSFFAEIEDPQPVLDVCPDVEQFMCNYVSKSSQALVRKEAEGLLPYVIVNHALNPLTAAFRRSSAKRCPLARGDMLMVTIDGLKQGKIKVGQFFDQINAYDSLLWKNWPLVDFQKQKEVPWMTIDEKI